MRNGCPMPRVPSSRLLVRSNSLAIIYYSGKMERIYVYVCLFRFILVVFCVVLFVSTQTNQSERVRCPCPVVACVGNLLNVTRSISLISFCISVTHDFGMTRHSVVWLTDSIPIVTYRFNHQHLVSTCNDSICLLHLSITHFPFTY